MADDAMPERTTLLTVAEVEACRAELVDSGYPPVEIINHDADHRDAGKAPSRAGWQHGPPIKRTDPGALNTGILSAGLRAIDIDIDNPTIAAAVKAKALLLLGDCPIRYRDNSPRSLLVYRAAIGEPVKRSIVSSAGWGKVEVLGKGQQFVAYGIHPTGAALRWTPEGPTTWTRDTLPTVTEEQITAFFADIAPIIMASLPGDHAAEPDRQASPLGQRGDLLDVLAALRAIPNDGPADWEAWNRTGMALWAATDGSDAGRDAWHAWSARHTAYDRQQTDARWNNYRTSPPTWLGAAALFGMARDHGWRRHQDDTPPETSPEARPEPTAEWWIARQIERPEPLLGEVITNTSRVMIGGQTGIGKSHLAMAIGAALATGRPFAHWRVHRPVRVMYVDGEMARDLVQERVADLKRRMGGADLCNLYVVCREDWPDLAPLNSEAGRVFIETKAKQWGIEVVFFDNRMSLLSGDMKDEVPWTETMELVRSLTKSRIAQVWIDHTGHDKTKIYGSSTKEWQLDAVALLSKVDRANADVAFQIEFTKARRRRPDTRADFEKVTLSLQDDEWRVNGAEAAPNKVRLSPMCAAFYAAFTDALSITSTPGTTTRAAWYAECVRTGIADEVPTGVDWRERTRRQSSFRKYVAELKAAGLIGVNGETINDLRKGPP